MFSLKENKSPLDIITKREHVEYFQRLGAVNFPLILFPLDGVTSLLLWWRDVLEAFLFFSRCRRVVALGIPISKK